MTESDSLMVNSVPPSNELLRAIPLSLTYFDTSLRLRFLSATAEAIWGVQSRDVLGKHVTAIFPSNAVESAEAYLNRALAGEVVVQRRFRDDAVVENTWVSNHFAPHRDASGAVIGVYVYSQSIDNHVRAESELRELSAMADFTPYPWAYVNAAQEFRFLNRAYLSMLGKKAEDVLGKRWQDVFQLDRSSVVIDAVERALKGEHVMYERQRIMHDKGETHWIRAVYEPRRDARGNVEGFFCVVTDIEDFKRAQALLTSQAQLDALTRLLNRNGLELQLNGLIERCTRTPNNEQNLFSVLFLDLDRFKTFNDTFGHRAGDTLLVAFANRLRDMIRAGDIVARQGGDEFILVLQNEHDQSADAGASRLIEALRRPLAVDGRELVVGASIGVARFPQDGRDAQTLLRRADTAMYRAKAAGRDQALLFRPEFEVQERRTTAMQRALRQALIDGLLGVKYQPCVDIRSNKVIGVEALARWSDSIFGNVSPAVFVEIAEDFGLIHQLGEYVLERAAQFAVRHPTLRVAVNISAAQLHDSTFPEHVARILARTGCSGEQLDFEVTESRELTDILATRVVTEIAQRFNIRFAIDDFGTGYSNLSALRRLPVRTLKLDRSLVVDLETSTQAKAIVAATMTLAEGLHLFVIAEGVETIAQRTALMELGCAALQGYLVSPAIDEAEIDVLLAANAA